MKKIMSLALVAMLAVAPVTASLAQDKSKCNKECCHKCCPEKCKGGKCTKEECKKCEKKGGCSKQQSVAI